MIISQLIDYLIDIKVKMSQTDKRDFKELEKNIRSLGLKCDESGNVESIYNNDVSITLSGETYEQSLCLHINKEYQPDETENNVKESYNCEDCGKELTMPEIGDTE